jgi:hypothetical protein
MPHPNGRHTPTGAVTGVAESQEFAGSSGRRDPGPLGRVFADQRSFVVRDRIELSIFRFQLNHAKRCGRAKTDVADERNRARRKVQNLRQQDQYTPSIRRDSDHTRNHHDRR